MVREDMTPYYDHKGITLYNQDCMEAMKEMPNKAFELAIVDPQYGIGLDMVYSHGTSKSGTIHAKKEWNNNPPTENYFIELHRVSRNQIIWGCNYFARWIPAVGRIIHDKQLQIDGTALRWSEADIASCSLQKRITMFRYRWNGNVQGNTINWKNTGIDARIHPTQKPVALYKWLLKNYAKPGDRILDTHLGSGSSAIACDVMGFELTGYEIDEDYFNAAVDRLKQHQSQVVLQL